MSFSMSEQIQALLADKRVTEALDLAKNANRTGMTREKFLKVGRTCSVVVQISAFLCVVDV